ncbi:hydrogenase maturation nickel metallochaperone HypA [Merismopedia glauca]|uniref:Hydrogenase maturation factor HypA n=1 Tax=Merismopedia glauca CCAP 1448/3 TaxID=1296344 RepID=A0A2T1C3Q0_9CYAN|nr:hydrogenase maturation nickel metallochaperone HypA [Merismopedia glauca]PSB02743.1 hydrogenase maturation nickel metallochaperone HypA [Merismopedia glauca CCAP 1448/3]
MHEVGLMENALAIALNYASRERASRIEQITLRIGDLSGVEPDALRFAFDVVTQGTIAERAKLIVESCPTLCFCHVCQTQFQPTQWDYECPTCQTWSMAIVQGKELELTSLEVS